jgi:hypothetical protein
MHAPYRVDTPGHQPSRATCACGSATAEDIRLAGFAVPIRLQEATWHPAGSRLRVSAGIWAVNATVGSDLEDGMKRTTAMRRTTEATAGAMRRFACWLRAMVGVRRSARAGFAGATLAMAAIVAPAPSPPPAHWLAYAQWAGSELQTRLSVGEEPQLVQLLAWLQRQRQRDAQPIPIVLRIWISPQGRIDRSEFTSLGAAQADRDLHALVEATPLPSPPPDMLQPLVLRLTLRPNPDYREAPPSPR